MFVSLDLLVQSWQFDLFCRLLGRRAQLSCNRVYYLCALLRLVLYLYFTSASPCRGNLVDGLALVFRTGSEPELCYEESCSSRLKYLTARE